MRACAVGIVKLEAGAPADDAQLLRRGLSNLLMVSALLLVVVSLGGVAMTAVADASCSGTWLCDGGTLASTARMGGAVMLATGLFVVGLYVQPKAANAGPQPPGQAHDPNVKLIEIGIVVVVTTVLTIVTANMAKAQDGRWSKWLTALSLLCAAVAIIEVMRLFFAIRKATTRQSRLRSAP